MPRLALLALVTCACGIPKTAPVPPRAGPLHPEAKVTYDDAATGALNGSVRHQSTDAPLGNAIVVLRSQGMPDLEMMTDDYGRYRFEGLPAGTYTVQVLVGHADVAKVFALTDSAKFSTTFSVDPENRIGCRLPASSDGDLDQSLFSVTSPAEARLLQVVVTRYRL